MVMSLPFPKNTLANSSCKKKLFERNGVQDFTDGMIGSVILVWTSGIVKSIVSGDCNVDYVWQIMADFQKLYIFSKYNVTMWHFF